MIEPQYVHQIKKGSTVTYGESSYRVQDDGRGFLHIVVKEKGERKKISIKQLLFCEVGSIQDHVFNGWFDVYDSFEEYNSFATAEFEWVK